jgi:hypothetical protein
MVQRLIDSKQIYQRLAPLKVGMAIPADVFVGDMADGRIPRWVVIQRRTVQGNGVQLLVEDQSPEKVTLKARTGAVTLPRRSILALPDSIRGTRVYAGEHGWPRTKHIDDLVYLAHAANKRAESGAAQPATHLSTKVLPDPLYPWYRATVVNEGALPEHATASRVEHGLCEGSVVYVRFWKQGQWAVWDGGQTAFILGEGQAKQALKSMRGEDGKPKRVNYQAEIEDGFSKALRAGADGYPSAHKD